jgi:hypothetical protein
VIYFFKLKERIQPDCYQITQLYSICKAMKNTKLNNGIKTAYLPKKIVKLKKLAMISIMIIKIKQWILLLSLFMEKKIFTL